MKHTFRPTHDRRRFLAGASSLLALPAMEAFAAPAATPGPRNFVAVGCYLGWHQNAFFPKQTGLNVKLPPTLTPLQDLREQFTVFSGLDHRAVNGHGAWSNFLCGKIPKSYSLDQRIADSLGQKTRFASIQTTAGTGEGRKAMSFTRQGMPLPMVQRPSVLYRQLFITREDRARTEHVLRSGRSSLDELVDDAKRLQRSLPAGDRENSTSISSPSARWKNA